MLFRSTQLRFRQADGTPVDFPGGLGPDGNGVDVTDGVVEAVAPLNLTSSFLVVTAGEAEGDVATETQAIAIPANQSAHTATITLSPASTALRGRVLDTRGEPARVDLGLARDMPSSLYEVADGRDYRSGSGFPQTGIAHRIESDRLGYYYFPLRDAGRYFVDVVADTGRDTYLATLFEETVAASGDAVDRDVTVGLRSGGAGCDDLSGVDVTPDVDYATQIQPLWQDCVGCHRLNSPNGGGLELTEGASWSALVGVDSVQVPGRKLVEPLEPESSYLLEKIGCDNPQVGNRMRPDSALSPAQQALVRDWIAQGALEEAMGPSTDAGVPDAAEPDLGAPDLGADAGVVTPDAGMEDAGSISPDAGAPIDAGAEPPRAIDVSGGCRCATRGPGALGPGLGLVLGALLFGARRRRR